MDLTNSEGNRFHDSVSLLNELLTIDLLLKREADSCGYDRTKGYVPLEPHS